MNYDDDDDTRRRMINGAEHIYGRRSLILSDRSRSHNFVCCVAVAMHIRMGGATGGGSRGEERARSIMNHKPVGGLWLVGRCSTGARY